MGPVYHCQSGLQFFGQDYVALTTPDLFFPGV